MQARPRRRDLCRGKGIVHDQETQPVELLDIGIADICEAGAAAGHLRAVVI